MAPMATRRSQPAKPVHRKRSTRQQPSDSWELLGSNNSRDSEAMDTDAQPGAAASSPPPSHNNLASAVTPLREMADRVGKEVETFAETLDRFLEDLPAYESRYDAAHELVVEFQEIAEASVRELRKAHEREMRVEMRREWREGLEEEEKEARMSSAGTSLKLSSDGGRKDGRWSARKQEQVRELRQWQQEADLWDLFRLMLELRPLEADREQLAAEQEERIKKLGQPHRYTPESELWDRFLLHDDLSRERFLVKKWLERTAAHQESDVEGIMEELEAKAGRGKGLWASGWLHTREKIKGEKRLRAWPSAEEMPLPQIRRAEDNEMLVTTLDPDAASRQQRSLEKPDAFFERAMWVACWEMLRRGKTWHEVCEWCEERREGWRAVCLGKELEDAASSTAAWKYVCRTAAQSGAMSDHEAAVFGLMGGDIPTVEKVCRSVDDFLYVHYNAALVQQFDQFLLGVCPEKATPQPWRRGYVDAAVNEKGQAEQAIANLLDRLKKGPKTKNEWAQPLKVIQGYLLADDVGSLIHTVGCAVSKAARSRGAEDIVFYRPAAEDPQGEVSVHEETEVALNPQSLRIVTHMSIVLRIMSPDQLPEDELNEDENVLIAYTQALRAAGKRLLIPLYASQLQRERYIIALGRVLQDITDSREQGEMLQLMQQYKLDVTSILTEQLLWVQEHNLKGGYADQPLRMIEPLGPDDIPNLFPGYKIRVGFFDQKLTEDDEAVVRMLQWYQLLKGKWTVSFEAFTTILRKCMVQGRIACARLIAQTFPYDVLATGKTYEAYGQAINPMDPSIPPALDSDSSASDLAPAHPHLHPQSRPNHHLTHHRPPRDTLATWRAEEHKYVRQSPRPSAVPSALKRAREAAHDAFEPLLSPDGILTTATTDLEAAELRHLRATLLPEAVLAYAALLHAAGNLITRDALLENMELGVAVAEEGNGLQEGFVRGGRMAELVRALAASSKAMLVLKAEGKPWKVRGREGKDLAMWELGVGGRGLAMGRR